MIKEEFDKFGLIKISNFVQDQDFYKLCENIDKEINFEYIKNEKKFSKLGGGLIGNININTGHYGNLIWSYLKKNNINKIIEQLTGLTENK